MSATDYQPSAQSQRSAWREQETNLPERVQQIINAVEMPSDVINDQRHFRRSVYHSVVSLRLFSEVADGEKRTIYARDISSHGLRFITPRALPVNERGIVSVARCDKQRLTVECTVVRCRPLLVGWYEGAIQFDRELESFAPEMIDLQPPAEPGWL